MPSRSGSPHLATPSWTHGWVPAGEGAPIPRACLAMIALPPSCINAAAGPEQPAKRKTAASGVFYPARPRVPLPLWPRSVAGSTKKGVATPPMGWEDATSAHGRSAWCAKRMRNHWCEETKVSPAHQKRTTPDLRRVGAAATAHQSQPCTLPPAMDQRSSRDEIGGEGVQFQALLFRHAKGWIPALPFAESIILCPDTRQMGA